MLRYMEKGRTYYFSFNFYTTMMDKMNDNMHKCGKLLWILAFVAFILAWFSGTQGVVFGFNAQFWFWNALVLGVLAIPVKMGGHMSKTGM